MTTFLTPSHVEQLGWVLLHSVWQFAVVGLVLFAVLAVLRRASATVRYAAGLVAISAAVAAPVATWLMLPHSDDAAQSSVVPDEVSLIVTTGGTMSAPEPSLRVATASTETASISRASNHVDVVSHAPIVTTGWHAAVERSLRPWLRPIVMAWCIGVLAFALRPVLSWHRLKRLRRNGISAVTGEVELTFRRVAHRLGVQHAVSILQSTLVQVPVVVGYLRPAILLPVGVLAELPPSQLEAIIAHELAHVRRHDFLVNLLQTLVETVFFYHPVVWWISRQIRNERENCCDDLAVAAFGDRAEYGRALLALEELRGATPALALGVRDGSLLARIRRLLHGGAPRPSVPRLRSSGATLASIMLLLALGVSLCLMWLAPDARGDMETAPDGDTAGTQAAPAVNRVLAADIKVSLPTFSADGRLLAVSTDHNNFGVQVFDTATGTRVQSLSITEPYPVLRHDWFNMPAVAMAFSPDASRLAVADQLGVLYVFDIASGRRLQAFHPSHRILELYGIPESRSLQYLDQHHFALLLGDRILAVYDEAGQESANAPGLTGFNAALRGDNGRMSAVSWQSDRVLVVDPVMGEVLARFQIPDGYHVLAVDMTRRGDLVAMADLHEILLWDVTGKQDLQRLRGEEHEQFLETVQFDPTARYLYTSSIQRDAQNPKRYKHIRMRIWDVRTGDTAWSLDLKGMPEFGFSPDSERAAIVYPGRNGVEIVSVAALIGAADAQVPPARRKAADPADDGSRNPDAGPLKNTVPDGRADVEAFKPFDCLIVDAATADPIPGDGFTINFLFKRPATADAPEETIDNLIWGPKATSRFQFLIPERSLAHPDRGKLIVQWGVGHPDYEIVNLPEQVPLAQILRDDPKSARDTFRRIAMQRKKPQADATPKTSRIVVSYNIQDAEPQSRIYVQDINGKGDIGTEVVGLSKFNRLQNGGTLTLQDLDPGDYQVARYRQVEIGQVGLSRIHTGLYLDRRQFKLQAGETKSIEFMRPNGKPVSGRVEGLKKLGLDEVIVCVCSENATDPESLSSLDVTIYDARHSDVEGRFTTERLSPGNYVILVEAYAPFKQEDLANTGIPVPRYVGTTKITVPETGDAPAADVTLRDTQAKAAADVNPPKSSIIVHYDIPDAEPEARVFVQDLDRRIDIGSIVEGPMKWNPLKNGETLELTDLEPGNYQVARRRLLEIGRVGDEILRNSTYFDRRPFALAAGETKRIDITRPNGKPVTGRVARMKDLRVERAIVYACSDNATDAESPSRLDVTIFDVQPCDEDGAFVTERLSPGDYVLIVKGYTAIPPEVLSRTGDIPPRYVGTARVTVPETGEPQAVEVTLQDMRQAATGPGSPAAARQSQLAAIAAIEKLGGDVHYDGNSREKSVLAVSFFENGRVVDSYLQHLQDLAGLVEVTLTSTRITDAGLKHLAGLKSLGSLSLTKTGITDEGLVWLKDMSRLEILELDGTAITDAGLAHLAGLSRLDLLLLGETRITDKGLVHLKGLTSLTTLTLDGTGVSDAGLEQLSGLTGLRDLRLRDTKVTDAGLPQLQKLTGLRTLVLDGTRISAGGLNQLRAALPDCRIYPQPAADLQSSIRFNVFDEAGQKAIAKFRVFPGYRRMTGDLDQPTWQVNDARTGKEGELLWPLKDLLADETAFLVEAEGYKPQVWTWVKKADGPKDLYFTLAEQPTGSLLLDCQLLDGAAHYTFHWNLFKPDEPRPGVLLETRDVKAANSQQSVFRNLIPGMYQLWRVRPIRFTDWTRHYGLDYREVHITAGQQTETRITRGAGHRVRGRILGLQALVGPFGGGGSQAPGGQADDETLACVLVRAADAPDPESPEGPLRVPTFDVAPANPDGRFVTEPLEPGTYRLYAQAYRRLTGQQRVRTGDITPSWVGSATVTVPADGEPEDVEIELKRAGADESPVPRPRPSSELN